MVIKMNSKALIIVGLAAVIATSTDIAFASNGTPHTRGADGDPSTAAQSDSTESGVSSDGSYDHAADSQAETTGESVLTASEASGAAVMSESPSQNIHEETVSGDDSGGSSFNVLPSASYTIKRVVDRNSGEEQAPQLVFGKYYSSCYLTLYNDCTAELCLSPSTGKSEKGTYSIYGDTMYVDHGDDRMSQYTVVFGDNSSIVYIVVSSGEYDVYFG